MVPRTQPVRRRNSSKINALIAFSFHAGIAVFVIFLAAREGLLGRQLRKISIEMVKEKQPEKPKELEKPKEIEPPKAEAPKVEVARAPKPEEVHRAPAPAAVASAPVVAPPAADLPSLVFDGGKTVQTSSDPVQLYKGGLEYAFRAHWTRPSGMEDDNFVDEVEISVDRSGDISDPSWKRSTGDAAWDGSVLSAIAAVKNIGRPPPAGFPERITVRFDLADTEPISQ